MASSSFYSGSSQDATNVNAVEDSKNAAALSEAAAAASAAAAANSAASGASSSSTATTKAAESASSATSSASSAAASQASRVASETAETAAETAKTAAETARDAAAASSTSSATSQAAASSSETNTAASAAAALASKNAAATSASTASTEASNSASSATAAEASNVAAGVAKVAAETAETNAETAQAASETAKTASEAAKVAAETAETNASTSSATATTQAGIATTKAGEAAASATASANSATASEAAKDAALAALDNFDDRYLGAKASDPTVDNDGNPLISGSLYFNTTDDVMKVYEGSQWVAAYASLSGALLAANNLSDLASASAGRTNLGLGTAATTASTDYATAAQGALAASATQPGDLATVATSGAYSDLSGTPSPFDPSTLATVATSGAYSDLSGTPTLGTAATAAATDFVAVTGDSMTGNLDITGTLTSDNGSSTTVLSGNSLVFDRNSANYIRTSDASGYLRLQTGSGDTAFFSANGDISFFEDTGTTPKFFWDSSAERLGIGTSFPDAKLSITENIVGDLIKVTGANATDLRIGNHALANGGIYINSQGGSGDLRLQTQGSTRMTLDSSGRVGIGTSSPSQKLHVEGAGNQFILLNNSTTNDGFYFKAGAGASSIQTNAGSHVMNFFTGGSERMRINSAGTVLIDTTNPDVSFSTSSGSALQPSGQTHHSAAGTSLVLNRTASDGTIAQFRKGGSTVGNIGTSSGVLYIDGPSGNGISLPNNGVLPATSGGARDNLTNLGASYARFKDLHLSGTAYVGTSLGIGTSSPDVFSRGYTRTVGISSSGSTSLAIQSAGDPQYPAIEMGRGSSRQFLISNQAAYSTIGTLENSPLRFLINSTERMRLDASGNLLVGTTSSTPHTGTSTGVAIRNDGGVFFTRANADVLNVNRTTSDGAIAQFRKDGTVVGSIGVDNTDNLTISGNSTHAGLNFSTSDIIPYKNGDYIDDDINLGFSGYRFKDLHLSGTANAANFNTTSDATLKTNVETLSGSLDAVKSLRGVSFDWLENGGSEIGVIAQEVEAVLPDVVSTNDEGIKSVKYGNMVAVLIEAIKEQQLRIEALEAKLGD